MVLCFYADSNHQEYKFLVSHWPLLLELGLACPRGKLSHRHRTRWRWESGWGICRDFFLEMSCKFTWHIDSRAEMNLQRFISSANPSHPIL